jgi:D-3-phosphoglycerate dehydrogenase
MFLVGKKFRLRNKVIVVGNAVINKDVLNTLSNNFEIISLSPKDFKDKLTDFQNTIAIWIHFDTFLESSFIDKIREVPFLITTTTGLTHISEEIQNLFGNRLISLRDRSDFLSNITATAEHAWELITFNNNFLNSLGSVALGNWHRQEFIRQRQISTQTIGIIGFGRLGKMVANYSRAFKMKTLVYDIDNDVNKEANLQNFEVTNSVDELISFSDIVSLHASLKNNQEKIFNKQVLSLISKPTLLVNTARAGLVDEIAIVEEIKSKPYLTYRTDVMAFEEDGSSIQDSLLWQESKQNQRILITPHMGGANKEAIDLCEKELLRYFLKLAAS